MMEKALFALLLAGCAAAPVHKGIAEISPLENASGDVSYSNPRELSQRKAGSDTSDIPVGGHIEYRFGEYILSGAVVDSMFVKAEVFRGEEKAEVDCVSNSTFTPTPNDGFSMSKLHTNLSGLKRTIIGCDILDPVGDEFLFVIRTEKSEHKFRVKTNLKNQGT